jgi:hypothetical protein
MLIPACEHHERHLAQHARFVENPHNEHAAGGIADSGAVKRSRGPVGITGYELYDASPITKQARR